MNIDWDSLVYIKDWSDALGRILAFAKSAIQRTDQEETEEAQDLLYQFIKKSPAGCEALDKIATEAAIDLYITIVTDAVKAIERHMADLKKATNLINGVTEENNSAAKKLQFQHVTAALDKATNVVETLKTLEQQLTKPDNDLLQKIDALLRAIKDVKGKTA